MQRSASELEKLRVGQARDIRHKLAYDVARDVRMMLLQCLHEMGGRIALSRSVPDQHNSRSTGNRAGNPFVERGIFRASLPSFLRVILMG